jgi:rare lipoprotein A
MRSFFAAILAALVFAGGASLPAEAATGSNFRAAGAYERTTRPDLHLARAWYDDDEVRPSRRWRMESRNWDRPRYAKQRYAKQRHARAAKRWKGHRHARTHAAKHRRVARAHTARHRRVARRAVPRTARVAVHRSARRNKAVQAVAAGTGITGVASYYWQGSRTATGERFNPEGMTAAHRTLPFGTRVRVTHLGNGRSVDVRINDRGPFIGGRIIDLSRGAAGILGMHQQGLARVSVTVLGR